MAELLRYEVDAAMLGSEFCGDGSDIARFCEILDTVVPSLDAIPITSLYNGANNEEHMYEYVMEDQWLQAVAIHFDQFPNAWEA